MGNIISNIITFFQNYFTSQSEKQREQLMEQVQNTQEEKHISGANNLLLRYEPKSKPKISNLPPPKRKK